jgi:membrane protease YdiL (CAAX protease family)
MNNVDTSPAKDFSDPISLISLLGFFLLSHFSRQFSSLFGLVVLLGIGFPLIWAFYTRNWSCLGFGKGKLSQALKWGIPAGVLSSLLGTLVINDFSMPDQLGKQLLVGIPLWILIISPFQEFFFRGWLQSSLSIRLGKHWGLLISNLAFTAWHYLSPIVDLAEFPLRSWTGLISTFLAGLIYGYAFQRSQSIIAPWLGHAISGIIFLIIGAMDLLQVIP